MPKIEEGSSITARERRIVLVAIDLALECSPVFRKDYGTEARELAIKLTEHKEEERRRKLTK